MGRSAQFAAALLALITASATAAPVDSGSTSYQLNAAHDGSATFSADLSKGLKRKWAIDLGQAVSYPVVVGNLAIVALGENPVTGKHKFQLVAVNLASGKTVWSRPLAGANVRAYLTADGPRVFAATDDSGVQAFSASDGKHLWTASTEGQTFGSYIPVALNGRVFVATTEIGTTDYAVDQITGKVIWHNLWWGAGGMAVTAADGKVYYPATCHIPAFAPQDGSTVWDTTNPTCNGGGGGVAAYHAGRLYATDVTFEGAGSVLNAANGNVQHALRGDAVPAFRDQTAYALSQPVPAAPYGSVIAYNLTFGTLDWRFAPKETLSTPPIVVNQAVFLLSDRGTLYVLNALTGKLRQSFKVCNPDSLYSSYRAYSGLGVGKGLVLVPCGTELAAFGS
jgi:outer membrane protein assembly factor BamB